MRICLVVLTLSTLCTLGARRHNPAVAQPEVVNPPVLLATNTTAETTSEIPDAGRSTSSKSHAAEAIQHAQSAMTSSKAFTKKARETIMNFLFGDDPYQGRKQTSEFFDLGLPDHRTKLTRRDPTWFKREYIDKYPGESLEKLSAMSLAAAGWRLGFGVGVSNCAKFHDGGVHRCRPPEGIKVPKGMMYACVAGECIPMSQKEFKDLVKHHAVFNAEKHKIEDRTVLHNLENVHARANVEAQIRQKYKIGHGVSPYTNFTAKYQKVTGDMNRRWGGTGVNEYSIDTALGHSVDVDGALEYCSDNMNTGHPLACEGVCVAKNISSVNGDSYYYTTAVTTNYLNEFEHMEEQSGTRETTGGWDCYHKLEWNTRYLTINVFYDAELSTNGWTHARIKELMSRTNSIFEHAIFYPHDRLWPASVLAYNCCAEIDSSTLPTAESDGTYNAVTYLDNFEDEMVDMFGTADAALSLLLTGEDLTGTVRGVTNANGMCDLHDGSILAQIDDWAAADDIMMIKNARIIAHEVGHTLGFVHDQDHDWECGRDYSVAEANRGQSWWDTQEFIMGETPIGNAINDGNETYIPNVLYSDCGGDDWDFYGLFEADCLINEYWPDAVYEVDNEWNTTSPTPAP